MKHEIIKKNGYTRYKILHKKSSSKDGECVFAFDYGNKLKFNHFIYGAYAGKINKTVNIWYTLKPAKYNGYNLYRSENGKVKNVSTCPIFSNLKTINKNRFNNVLKTFIKNNNLKTQQISTVDICYPCLNEVPYIKCLFLPRLARKSKTRKDFYNAYFGTSDIKFINNTEEFISKNDLALIRGYILKKQFDNDDLAFLLTKNNSVSLSYNPNRSNYLDIKSTLKKISKQAKQKLVTDSVFGYLDSKVSNICRKINKSKNYDLLNTHTFNIVSTIQNISSDSINNPEELFDLNGTKITVDKLTFVINIPYNIDDTLYSRKYYDDINWIINLVPLNHDGGISVINFGHDQTSFNSSAGPTKYSTQQKIINIVKEKVDAIIE